MKIACVILGTRGDVQPMIALATGLIRRGHEATVYAPPENEELARRYDCPFVAFGPGIRDQIRQNPEKQKGGVAVTISPKQGKKLTLDQMSLLPQRIGEADLVLGAGIVMGVQTAADLLKAPYRMVIFYPVMLGTHPDDPLKNRMMFGFGRSMINLMVRGFINKFRKGQGLPPIRDAWSHWVGDEVIVACDPELNAAREGVAFPFIQTRFMMLPSKAELSPEVEAFLAAGEPPVYIGFGSNPISQGEKYANIFGQVQRATGRRLIVSKGWAELPGEDSGDILFVGEVPFDKLFPRLAAVVYHGGTGTLAAIARAGIPQAAFPFMGDQFDNRKRIIELGLGPSTCDFKAMTAESIIGAVNACLTDDRYRKNAAEMAEKLKGTDGTEMTIDWIEKRFGQ